MTAPDAKQIPHLFAGLIALALAAIVLFAAHRALIHLEHATIASTAPESFALKNQGLVFQRAAAHSPTVRAQGQTYQIARRLHRGELLFEE